MWFLQIADELSEGLKTLVENAPFVLPPQIPNCVIFFSQLKSVFLQPELSRGAAIATEIGQAVVDLKLGIK